MINELNSLNNKQFIILHEEDEGLDNRKKFLGCPLQPIRQRINFSGMKFDPTVVLLFQDSLHWSKIHKLMLETTAAGCKDIVMNMDVVRRSVPKMVSAKVVDDNLKIFIGEKIVYDDKINYEKEHGMRSYIYKIAISVSKPTPLFRNLNFSSYMPPIEKPVIDFSVEHLAKNPDQNKWNNLLSLILLNRKCIIDDHDALKIGMPAILSRDLNILINEYINDISFKNGLNTDSIDLKIEKLIQAGLESENFEAFYRDAFRYKGSDGLEYPLIEKLMRMRMRHIVQEEPSIIRRRQAI